MYEAIGIKESFKKLSQTLLFNEFKISLTGIPLIYLQNTPTHLHIHGTYTISFIPMICVIFGARVYLMWSIVITLGQ